MFLHINNLKRGVYMLENKYKKIYKSLIEKAKKENRKKKCGEYYESHHIIPDFMFRDRKRKGPKGTLSGNPNDKNNLVLLTAREHFIAHVLLYKIYKGTKYEYSAGSALSFFTTKVIKNRNHNRNDWFNQSCSKKYDFYRKIGLESISKARKGKMPVVDAKTRESIGSVEVNHPKVLSGEWVHHSKGRKISESEKSNRQSKAGFRNDNYKGWTKQYEETTLLILKSIENNNIISRKDFFNDMKKYKGDRAKYFSITLINNQYGDFVNFINIINERNNTQYKFLGKFYKRK